MRIQHNIMAINAYRNYTNNVSAMKANLEKLSSGYKINRAGDDAAGLAISEKMRAQITGLETAQKNAKDGISLVQTAEGALTEVHDMLNRMVELATQSANGTYDNTTDRYQLQKEMDQLRTEINRIADSANFNGIKLLDGKGGAGQLSELPVEYDTISATNGITIGDIQDGGGSNGVYTITLDKKFSWGDTITVTGTSDGSTSIGGTAITMAPTGATNTFKGDTIEEQASSIADALTGQIGGSFDVKAEGNQIIMTAKKAGTEKVGTITTLATSGTAVTGATLAATTTAAASGNAKSSQVLHLFGNDTAGANKAANLNEGDIVTLAFKGADGNLLTHSFKVTAEMAAADSDVAMGAIVDYLNSDEAVFDDNNVHDTAAIKIGSTEYERKNTTGIDESKMKLSDLFIFSKDTNNGDLKVEAKTATTMADTLGFVVDREGTKTSFAPKTGGTAATADGGAAAQKTTLTLAAAGNNFTAGDKVKLNGTLADGRTFSIELTAGEDFAIDGSNTVATANSKTLKNLADALKSDKVTVSLKDKEGNDAGTMKASDLFGDGTDTETLKEFKVTNTDTTVVIEATKKGFATTGEASNLDNISTAAAATTSTAGKTEIVSVADAKTTLVKQPGKANTAASSTFTLGEGLEYGAAVRIGDHTYEIVKDAADLSNRRNTAIVVGDLSDTKAVASAIQNAINENETDYTAKAVDGTVTVSSKGVGTDQKALSVTMPYGDKITVAKFKFDPKAVRENATLEFGGNTYEFVKMGGKATNEGAIAVEVRDFKQATSKTLGDTFADVLRNGSASVAEDGTITLKGEELDDGKFAYPSVRFENNLILQIGDTAESFNQLKVNLSDMHVDAMGIGDIRIDDQTSAADAIDKIKSAINYVSDVRGTLGATQNRLDHTINNLSVMTENIQDAESTIRDTDVADEMMAYTKNNIPIQSAQAMLAQANQVPQGVLQLLQ